MGPGWVGGGKGATYTGDLGQKPSHRAGTSCGLQEDMAGVIQQQFRGPFVGNRLACGSGRLQPGVGRVGHPVSACVV